MSTPVKQFQVPYKETLVDAQSLVTDLWGWFFRAVWERLYSLGFERSFILINNQTTPADITDMKFNSSGVSQVFIDYLVQRITTSSGATELIEAGILLLAYRPVTAEWKMIKLQTNSPDDSGIDFAVTPAAFTATYDHTNATWTKIAHGLINGYPVEVSASTSLPTGYSAGVVYYVISAADDTFKLSASVGGSAVTAATNNGTGAQTVTPQLSIDGQVKYISSNISGTAQTSNLFWRARSLGGKTKQYSSLGSR